MSHISSGRLVSKNTRKQSNQRHFNQFWLQPVDYQSRRVRVVDKAVLDHSTLINFQMSLMQRDRGDGSLLLVWILLGVNPFNYFILLIKQRNDDISLLDLYS